MSKQTGSFHSPKYEHKMLQEFQQRVYQTFQSDNQRDKMISASQRNPYQIMLL